MRPSASASRAEVAVEVAAPEDIEHYDHVRRTGLSRRDDRHAALVPTLPLDGQRKRPGCHSGSLPPLAPRRG